MKIRALKQSILLILSGESLPRVLMSVIRFCSNADDHMLKKLLMLYWEVSKRDRSSSSLGACIDRSAGWSDEGGAAPHAPSFKLSTNKQIFPSQPPPPNSTPNPNRWCPSTTAPPKSSCTR